MKRVNMNKKVFVIMAIILLIIALLIILCGIYGWLTITGYTISGDWSDDIFQEIKEKSKINFNDIIEKEWDVAICATYKNEEAIIKKYKENGIIKEITNYGGLTSSLQQLNVILFFGDGKLIDKLIYDSRYYELLCDEEYFYSEDCDFKIKKEKNKTILEKINNI